MTINERFKEIRLNLNKTQADFGEQCGLGRAVIANIENNRSPVTPLYIKVVVDNFGVNEYGDVTIPFVDRFPRGEIYNLLTTRPEDLKNEAKTE